MSAASLRLCFYLAISIVTSACGGYSDSTNNALSENQINTHNLFNGDTSPKITPTPNSEPLDIALLQSGLQFYTDQQCGACHGEKGKGPSILINCVTCNNLASLSETIRTSMPPTNPGSCDQACADATAYYILAGFPDLTNIIGLTH